MFRPSCLPNNYDPYINAQEPKCHRNISLHTLFQKLYDGRNRVDKQRSKLLDHTASIHVTKEWTNANGFKQRTGIQGEASGTSSSLVELHSSCVKRKDRPDITLTLPPIVIQHYSGSDDNLRKSPKASSDFLVDESVGLSGSQMTAYFRLWSRKKRSRTLGRGPMEIPRGFLRQDRYRPCGCDSRHHNSSKSQLFNTIETTCT